MRLDNRVAVVTGGGSGIGAATARRFASEGAAVIVTDLNEETGARVIGEIRASGGRAEFLPLNTADDDAVRRVLREVATRHGRLDIMFCNAGIGGGGFEDPRDRWREVIAVNLSGVYSGCRYAMEIMSEGDGGSIVNTASMAGLVGGYGDAYSAAKAGVIGLTRQMALEGAPKGIRVNCICPGYIKTEMTRPAWEDEQLTERILRNVPVRRWAEPDEIAAAVAFLASADASYITGHALVIDGGYTAR